MIQMSQHPPYHASDIWIIDDAIAFIRKRPQMFVGDDPIGADFVKRIVSDLILLDAGPLRVARHGDWYAIAAEKDWLMSEDGTVSFEPFHRLIPMPSGGLFYDRAEVILNALTDAVVTSGADGVTWISGDATHWPLPDDLELMPPSTTGRMIAFHFIKFQATDAAS